MLIPIEFISKKRGLLDPADYEVRICVLPVWNFDSANSDSQNFLMSLDFWLQTCFATALAGIVYSSLCLCCNDVDCGCYLQ